MSTPIDSKYTLEVDPEATANIAKQALSASGNSLNDRERLSLCLSLMDLTSLNPTDSEERGQYLAERVNGLGATYPGTPNVAAICVYPLLVAAVRETLRADGVRIASVAAGFPASQTFLEVKTSECLQCLASGADELDIVMPLGYFLEGNYFNVFGELRQLKEACGSAKLKVILETGALPSPSHIRLASFLAMEAGADFIKTSTGKLEPAATPEAVVEMCGAIRDFYRATGRRVGIKPAGGMSVPADSLLYLQIVEDILGSDWLNPNLLRFGASRLVDGLLSSITGGDVKYFSAAAAGSKY